MNKFPPRLSLLCLAGVLLASRPLAAQTTFVFQQNDVGQTVTNGDGSQYTYPDNNLWTQPFTTSPDLNGNTYTSALTNWTVQTAFPNASGVTALIGPSSSTNEGVSFNGAHLNESVSIQNLTLTGGALLLVDSSNSGGAGNHAITFALGSGGAGTVQNDGTIEINGTDQNTTMVAASALTISGGGTLGLGRAFFNGPGVITHTGPHLIEGGGGSTLGASLTNESTITANDYGDYVNGSTLVSSFNLTGAVINNSGTLSATGNGTLYLTGSAINNTGGVIASESVANANFVQPYGIYLSGGVSITGGTLTSTGAAAGSPGTFFVPDTASLTGLTLSTGTNVRVDGTLNLNDAIANGGVITVNDYNFNEGIPVTLNVASNTTLTGGGNVHIVSRGQLNVASGQTLTQGIGNTIQGNGTIAGSIDNAGLILSNAGGTLTVKPATSTNSGTMSATASSLLYLSGGTIDNTGGTLSCPDTNSQLYIDGGVAITGGTLSSVNSDAGGNGICTPTVGPP